MAGRTAGRNAKIYIDVSANASGAASPVSYINSWSADLSRDAIDVTSFGDANRVSVMGLASASGQFDGIVDMGTATFKNVTDGNARKLYLYPDSGTSTTYFFSTAYFDSSYSASVTDAIKVSMKWSAASEFSTVGSL